RLDRSHHRHYLRVGFHDLQINLAGKNGSCVLVEYQDSPAGSAYRGVAFTRAISCLIGGHVQASAATGTVRSRNLGLAGNEEAALIGAVEILRVQRVDDALQ